MKKVLQHRPSTAPPQKNTRLPKFTSCAIEIYSRCNRLIHLQSRQERYRPMTCLHRHRKEADVELQFVTLALERGGWTGLRPGRFIPRETWYPLHRRLNGPHRRTGWVRRISSPPEVDYQPFQPVTARHTNYATPAALLGKNSAEILVHCLQHRTLGQDFKRFHAVSFLAVVSECVTVTRYPSLKT